MRSLLPFLFALLLLSSCATRRVLSDPSDTLPARSTVVAGVPAAVAIPDSVDGKSITPSITDDSATLKPVKRGISKVLSGIFSSKTKPVHIQNPAALAALGKCKRCPITINQVTGTQTNTQTTVGKKGQAATDGSTLEAQTKTRGPAATGQSVARDNRGVGVNSEIKGDNNRPKLSNEQEAAPSPLAQLAKSFGGPTGLAVGLIALIFALAWGGPWLIGRIRRTTQAAKSDSNA